MWDKFLSNWEKDLPASFDRPLLQWVQWIYALWQIGRSNALVVVLVLLSIFPYYMRKFIWKMRKMENKHIVVLQPGRYGFQPYATTHPDMLTYFERHEPSTFKVLETVQWCRKIEYNGLCYITHINKMCEMAYLLDRIGENNIIFVDNMKNVTVSLAVGQELTQREAYELIWRESRNCCRGAEKVVPTYMNYVDISSKIWGVLSIIPILLQAKKFDKLSNVVSLVVIVLDLSSRWMFKIYDPVFFHIVKFVKLRIFKDRTNLYHLFSIFSSRWSYSDSTRKCSYMTKIGEERWIGRTPRLNDFSDIEILEWDFYNEASNAEEVFLEISFDRATCKLKKYGGHYARARFNKSIYVD